MEFTDPPAEDIRVPRRWPGAFIRVVGKESTPWEFARAGTDFVKKPRCTAEKAVEGLYARETDFYRQSHLKSPNEVSDLRGRSVIKAAAELPSVQSARWYCGRRWRDLSNFKSNRRCELRQSFHEKS